MTRDDMRRWRKELGLNQTQAAKMLGYAERRSVVRWEGNEKRIPRHIALACAAIAAGLAPYGT